MRDTRESSRYRHRDRRVTLDRKEEGRKDGYSRWNEKWLVASSLGGCEDTAIRIHLTAR